ncbi:class I SAM-dependent methyltransferase [Mycolicibacterium sarraceniae]|uniref:O-methyltransferase n=1 Tax=Mycolicibacterium sarraceniae TaxID=1534348 RepID=A0A7I7ST53_9MYCO|nr:class I SAM-dependent methyltransferase [Mycolicibacterium sarraceniae]BBY59329.1 hypothetical protein MSAR_24650 [Mycolicibacterium sarraceniae]
MNSSDDIERALRWPAEAPGIDLREAEQLALFRDLVPLFDGVPERRYKTNGMYGPADASLYQAMVRHLSPQRVVEVGSGYSTAKLLDTAEYLLPDLRVTCVEPYPDRLLALLKSGDKVDVTVCPVQDADMEIFTSLEDSDILFIDSTHVAKAGSDVVWLFLHVLPRLRKGVVVHVHDIFWPFEYPAQWHNEGRNWNEDYFLHAFLCNNSAWRIEVFSSWLWHRHSELVPSDLRAESPGSIWLRRC